MKNATVAVARSTAPARPAHFAFWPKAVRQGSLVPWRRSTVAQPNSARLPAMRCSGDASRSKVAGRRTRFGVVGRKKLTEEACPWQRGLVVGERCHRAGVGFTGGVRVVGEAWGGVEGVVEGPERAIHHGSVTMSKGAVWGCAEVVKQVEVEKGGSAPLISARGGGMKAVRWR
jgi:hypothetical protein